MTLHSSRAFVLAGWIRENVPGVDHVGVVGGEDALLICSEPKLNKEQQKKVLDHLAENVAFESCVVKFL